MNSQDYRNLQEAYLNVYQELDEAVYGGEPKKAEEPKDTRLVVTNADKKGNTPAYQNFKKGDKRYKAADHMGEETRELDEVRGGGKIDAVANIPSIGERGSRTSTDAGMQMPPLERAKARANALKRRNDPEATKRANRINSRFVNPTNSAINRSLLAATNAKHAEKTRLQKLNNSYDLFDYMMEYLIDEGYGDTNENALVIMAHMSEEWRESIVEVTGYGRIDPIGDAAGYGAGVGERNSRTPKDAGLKMSPIDRAKARANALKKRNDPDATRRANQINSRFVNPTNRALDRSMLAANNQKIATAKRLRQQQQDQAQG